MKKVLLLMMLCVMHICVWGQGTGPQISIGDYVHNLDQNYNKFKEPTVTITDNGELVTNMFRITYYVNGKQTTSEGAFPTFENGREYTEDDAHTITVDRLYGNVETLAGQGTVKIIIKAEPKTDPSINTKNYTETIWSNPNDYYVTISAPTPTVTYMPGLANNLVLVSEVSITKLEPEVDSWNYTIGKASTQLPTPKILDPNGNDITSKYNITKTLTKLDGTALAAESKYLLVDNVIRVGGGVNHDQDINGVASTETEAQAAFPSEELKLTYTFTLKSEFANSYNPIPNKEVTVVTKPSFAGTTQSVHLELTRDMISEENVTTLATVGEQTVQDEHGNPLYLIHVYKYGWGDHTTNNNYQYFTPNPAIVTESGAIMPFLGARGSGQYGDFELVYEVLDGKEKETDANVIDPVTGLVMGSYMDDCQYRPYWGGTIVPEGMKTTWGGVSNDKFHVGIPGLVRIAVYAGIATNNTAGKITPTKFEVKKDGSGNDKIVKDWYGNDYYVYTDPLYFYVDVMKRVPTLEFDPDPSKMTFAVGDKISVANRFNLTGYIDDNSNGEAGEQQWGGTDHFNYTFFLSDRARYDEVTNPNGTIKINDWATEYTKWDNTTYKYVNDWEKWTAEGGDKYSYISWEPQTESSIAKLKGDDKNVKVGDKIQVSEGVWKLVVAEDAAVVDTENEIKITEIGEHTVLQSGDQIKGITYYSTKGYGEKFERWTMEFTQKGSYDITYTIVPWNHQRWDCGNGEAGTVTYTYNVDETVPTEITLTHNEIIAYVCDPVEEPTAKVVVPKYDNEDVTSFFDLSYAPKEYTEAGEDLVVIPSTATSYYESGYATLAHKITGEYDWQTTYTRILKVNETTGDVTLNDSYFTDTYLANHSNRTTFEIVVSASIKAGRTGYDNPTAKSYTINVVSCYGRAKYEIIASCKDEAIKCTSPVGASGDFRLNEGKFHFLSAGWIYGGTVFSGVPGVDMTLGTVNSTDATWTVSATSDASITNECCSHETDTHAFATHTNNPTVGTDKIPTDGQFFVFTPITNGYLTIDAYVESGNAVLIRKNDVTGEITEAGHVAPNTPGEFKFANPLLVGSTYYLYVEGAKLNLHGFSYEPAYIHVKVEEGVETYKQTGVDEDYPAYLFLNGLKRDFPTLLNDPDATVTFSLTKVGGADAADIATINPSTGAISAKKISNDCLKVTATVTSSDGTITGDCADKYPTFYFKVLDIPTYRILDNKDDYEPTPGTVVRTTNIPTAITMTFGGWRDKDHKYKVEYEEDGETIKSSLTDTWSYKSAGGPASRIGNEIADNSAVWNKTIDGFDYFIAGAQNPIDENNNLALLSGTGAKGNNSTYNYASGTAAETSQTEYFNTTYKLPCRGSYLKFEPEESGVVLLYIVQNGSCDYHYGIAASESNAQVKWRPLFITDETGKTVDMLGKNDFDGFKELLPSGADPNIVGYYTECLSRCNPKEDAIAAFTGSVAAENKVAECSFDWSAFKGTPEDRQRLFEAWKPKGTREGVIKLDQGGYVLPHKGYVRYAFNVKAGKTYFVFQLGSKFEFGGFSFVPTGYPNTCKYQIEWRNKPVDAPINSMWTWEPEVNGTTQEHNVDLTWKSSISDFSSLDYKENLNVTIQDAASGTKSRNCTTGKWNSICLPFSVSEKQMKSKFGNTYVLVSCDGVNDEGQLQFTRHANGYIEAGRPYLFKPATTVNGLTFDNVTIENEAKAKTTTGEVSLIDPDRFNVEVENYTFKGFYTSQLMPKGSVYAASDGLYMYNGGNDGNTVSSIGGYRALFSLPPAAVPAAKAMTFYVNDLSDLEKEGSTTGIMYVANDELKILDSDAAIYSIDGKKLGRGTDALNRLGKGIYVVDGQKIVK